MDSKIARENILTDKHGQEWFNKISKMQPCPTRSKLVKFFELFKVAK